MKATTKLAMSAVLACGAVFAVAGPAAAQVRFGFGVGPGYAVPAPTYTCYDAYGSYISTDPYCNAYGAPSYAPPAYYGGYGYEQRGWDRDRDRHYDRDRDRDHRDRERAYEGRGDRDRR